MSYAFNPFTGKFDYYQAAGSSTNLSATLVISVATTPYNVVSTALILLVDTSVPRQINLPSPSTYRILQIKDATGSANTNNITLHRNASEQIEGIAADKLLTTNWGAWTVVSNGTNWFFVD